MAFSHAICHLLTYYTFSWLWYPLHHIYDNTNIRLTAIFHKTPRNFICFRSFYARLWFCFLLICCLLSPLGQSDCFKGDERVKFLSFYQHFIHFLFVILYTLPLFRLLILTKREKKKQIRKTAYRNFDSINHFTKQKVS